MVGIIPPNPKRFGGFLLPLLLLENLFNVELAHLKFKEKYVFDVKYMKDGSNCGKILEYDKYLKKCEDLEITSGQMKFDEMTSYSNNKREKDIKKIINYIVENNDKEQIEHYVDYHNYMIYEIYYEKKRIIRLTIGYTLYIL